DNVKLGIDFPKDVTVLRKEVHDRVMQENISALQSDNDAIDFLELNDVSFNNSTANDKVNSDNIDDNKSFINNDNIDTDHDKNS
ncbi:MAG: carbon storage regulator, partial [Pseudomonadota bacterium]